MEGQLISFEDKTIRKVWHDAQWFFSIIDTIEILTDSKDPKQYWKRLNQRDKEIKGGVQIVPLLSDTVGGKQKIICTNTEGIFRIIMSVPSFKAEPLKLWLAQVGKERIEETENPEISIDRLTQLYQAKGYDDIWIGNRLKTIGIRKELTEEWKARGIKEGHEYSILTAEIAKATFGLTPTEHAKLKGLEKQNLRDHMTNLELVFTALSEEVTRAIAVRDNAQGFNQNQEAAVTGGRFAGSARERLENEQGIKVVSTKNYLDTPKSKNEALQEDKDKIKD